MQPGVVIGAGLELAAETANAGSAPGVNTPVFTTAWANTSGSGGHVDLTGMAGTAASGWAGTGIGTDPYRLVFDAVDDYVDLAEALTYLAGLFSTKHFTIECWAAFGDGLPGGTVNWPMFFAFDGDGSEVVQMKMVNGVSVFSVAAGGDPRIAGSDQVTNDGLMHHIVGTADGSYLRLYVDGDLQGDPVAMSANAIGAVAAAHLGNADGWADWCNWECAVARVYPFALSDAQVRQNYNASKARLYPHPLSPVYNGTWVRYGELPNTIGECSVQWNGSVWQMWGVSLSPDAHYSTSPTLMGPWTVGATQPLGGATGTGPGDTYNRMQVRVLDGVYHCLAAANYTGDEGLSSNIDHFTSPDGGLTWTYVNTVIEAGTDPDWDFMMLGNTEFWLDDDGSYYIMYEAGPGKLSMGMAMGASMSGAFLKYGGNPVLDDPFLSSNSPTLLKKNGTYYCWFMGGHPTGLPSDILRASARNPLGPWTIDCNPLLAREIAEEGVGWHYGQVADPEVVEHGGKLYMFYSASTDGISPSADWSERLAVALLPVLGTPAEATALYLDLMMFSGDTAAIPLTFPCDLTACTITWAIAQTPGGTALVTKAATVASAASGEAYVSLLADDTAALSGFHYHEAQVTDSDGVLKTLIYGRLLIMPDSA